MMDVRVFGDHVYTTAILTLFTVLFSVYGLLRVLTQYLQTVRDDSPERAGVVLLSFTGPMSVKFPPAWHLLNAPIEGGMSVHFTALDGEPIYSDRIMSSRIP